MNYCPIRKLLTDGRSLIFKHFPVSTVVLRVVVILAVSIGLAVSIKAQFQESHACGLGPEQLPQLNLLSIQTGRLDPGEARCFGLLMQAGEFLHQEMGFDVLAFESGLFGASAAWRALQTDTEPREAFLKGAFRVSGWSEQVQPLIRYLSSSARTDGPLELTGFDSQFTGTASKEFLLPSLREFLTQNGIGGLLSDPASMASRILKGILDGSFWGDRERLPKPAEQAELVASLRGTASEVEKRVTGFPPEVLQQ